ncbi:MAG TPA: hypothetical protein V6C81_26725 [Planktothrix sp.]
MSEITEADLSELKKKVDDQSRFTRSLILICTLTIWAVQVYTLTEIFNSLPSAILLHDMANLEKIVYEWNVIESNAAKAKGSEPPASGAQSK